MTRSPDDNDQKPPRGSSYEVGYKKPPKATQFKKGQSGNPSGRPRHKPSFAEAAQQVLSQPVAVRGQPGKKMLGVKALAQNMFACAIQGNVKAAKLLLDESKTLPPEPWPTHVQFTTRFVRAGDKIE